MNPKANCGVLYSPLRGIVQLTNSAMLRFRNWSFTINLFCNIHFFKKYSKNDFVFVDFIHTKKEFAKTKKRIKDMMLQK